MFRSWHAFFGPSAHPGCEARFAHFDRHGHRHGHDRRDSWHSGSDSRRGRSRMFEQGDLRYVILKLLSQKPAHGYEIIKSVEQLFGGSYAPSPGIVYPTLTLLEEQGFIEVVELVGARKLYGLTEAGRAELERTQGDVARVFGRMQEYRARYGGGPAPEIRRAMDNLHAALHLRLERSDAGDKIRQITAILDGAARAIEDS